MVMLRKIMWGVALIACSSSMLVAGKKGKGMAGGSPKLGSPRSGLTLERKIAGVDLKGFRKKSEGDRAAEAIIEAIRAFNERADSEKQVAVPALLDVWRALMDARVLDSPLGKDYDRANQAFVAAVVALCLGEEAE